MKKILGLLLAITIVFGACTKDNTTTGSCGNLVVDSWCIDNVYYTQFMGDDYASMSYDAIATSPSQTVIEFDISNLDASVTPGTYQFYFHPNNQSDSIPANKMHIKVYKGSSKLFLHKTSTGTINVADDAGKRIVSFNNENFFNIMDTTEIINVSAKVRVR